MIEEGEHTVGMKIQRGRKTKKGRQIIEEGGHREGRRQQRAKATAEREGGRRERRRL